MLSRLWHRFRCWRGKHLMVLYNVGLNYGRECLWCRVHGRLSQVDIRQLFNSRKPRPGDKESNVLEEDETTT